MEWLLRQLASLLLRADLDEVSEDNGSDVLLELEVNISVP